MDVLFGVKGKDFVMLCEDTTATFSQIFKIKHDEEKIVEIDSHKLMGLAGAPGDRVQFSEYISANVRLYALRNGIKLSTKAVANFTRGELAGSLRKKPYATDIVICGYDENTGASLYLLDHLATLHKMNFTGKGYGALFLISYLDKNWRDDLNEEEALQMMIAAVGEVKQRLLTAPSNYVIKVVDKNGIRIVKNL